MPQHFSKPVRTYLGRLTTGRGALRPLCFLTGNAPERSRTLSMSPDEEGADLVAGAAEFLVVCKNLRARLNTDNNDSRPNPYE
ncbi:hypothetical protein [Paraburkholderia sp. GAS42]|uniref:hypothetical protein n=1 Tax=Paraburkholderia sp. GAS42 TaxID=3035135 RepID=UPI003D197DB5